MTRVRILLPAALLLASAAQAAGLPSEFTKAMDVAMDRMMADMHVPSSGDVDRDFVTMMIPHHQGAIDMAVAELRYGTDPNLKRIAQEIIIEQQQEIAAMRLAMGDPLPPSAPAPTQQHDHQPSAQEH